MIASRIDAHQHFWHYTPIEYEWIGQDESVLKRDFLPEALIEELAKANYSGSIAVQARQSVEETRWLLNLDEMFLKR